MWASQDGNAPAAQCAGFGPPRSHLEDHTPISVRDRAAARAQFQQQRVIGDEPVLVFIRNRLDLLNKHLPARIYAEVMGPSNDLGHAEFAPALVHIEDGDTQKSPVGWSVRVAEGKPERRHRSSP